MVSVPSSRFRRVREHTINSFMTNVMFVVPPLFLNEMSYPDQCDASEECLHVNGTYSVFIGPILSEYVWQQW